MPSRLLVALAFLLSLMAVPARPASAHTLFFRHDAGAWRLVQGHPGTPEASPLREPVAIRLWIVTPDTLVPFPSLPPNGTSVPDAALPPSAVGLLAAVDWGVWTKTPEGTRHAPPDSVDDPLESWRSRETLLQLFHPAAVPPLPGRHLEIRPLSPPDRWRRGRKLRVRLTRDGRPLPGVTVAYDHRARGTTGRDGTINVRLRHAGWQAIAGSLRLPPPAGSPVATVLAATLVFPLEDRP